ncbi:MAG: hypothetical protein H7A49_05860 [Akkermansiaceae bacterium]|nr:hypothetical protein [Akkermansiaceae bacterium]
MIAKSLATGGVVGSLIFLAALAYGCRMGLEEPEFGWMAGAMVAALGLVGGFVAFLISLVVGLVAKGVEAAAKKSKEARNGTDQT